MYYMNNAEANMYYCEQAAENMYPKMYKDIYPHVKGMCENADNPNNPMMFPFPNEEVVDNMVQDIYKEFKNNKPKEEVAGEEEHENMYRIRRRDTEDFIKVLLLRELLGRRRRFFRRPSRRRPFGGYGRYGFY